MTYRLEQDLEREQELAVLTRQQKVTDDRVQSLSDRFSNIENALKDLTNSITSNSEVNPRNCNSAVGYKKLPDGILVSSVFSCTSGSTILLPTHIFMTSIRQECSLLSAYQIN